MKLNFEWYEPLLFIEKLSEQIGVVSDRSYLEEKITLPKAFGTGTITGFQFRNGISLLLFDVTLEKKWELNFKNESVPPLQFNYVVEGNIYHQVKAFNFFERIDLMHNSIIGSVIDCEQTLIFPPRTPFTLAILQVNRQAYCDEIKKYTKSCPLEIKHLFEDVHAKDFHFDMKRFSIRTARCINKISKLSSIGVTKNILAESIALEILGIQVRMIKESLLSKTREVKLSQTDIEKITLAKDILQKQFSNPPTIIELAKRIGVNQQKLKSGFKELFEVTINKYTTNIRIKEAAEFIGAGYNVREAMLKVGYANFGFFAKKFKERFGVLPKDYRKNVYNRIKAG